MDSLGGPLLLFSARMSELLQPSRLCSMLPADVCETSADV